MSWYSAHGPQGLHVNFMQLTLAPSVTPRLGGFLSERRITLSLGAFLLLVMILGRSAAALWNFVEPHQEQEAELPGAGKIGMPRLKELLLWLPEGGPKPRSLHDSSTRERSFSSS